MFMTFPVSSIKWLVKVQKDEINKLPRSQRKMSSRKTVKSKIIAREISRYLKIAVAHEMKFDQMFDLHQIDMRRMISMDN